MACHDFEKKWQLFCQLAHENFSILSLSGEYIMATVKIATLLIKSLAKPIATKIKTQAKNHPAFKKFCVDVAQRSHRMEMSLKMRFMDYKIKNVRPLEEVDQVLISTSYWEI